HKLRWESQQGVQPGVIKPVGSFEGKVLSGTGQYLRRGGRQESGLQKRRPESHKLREERRNCLQRGPKHFSRGSSARTYSSPAAIAEPIRRRSIPRSRTELPHNQQQ